MPHRPYPNQTKCYGDKGSLQLKGVELKQGQEQDPSGLWHLNNMDSHQQASVCCGPTACSVKGFVVCK